MSSKVYVSNLSYNTTEETLRKVFSEENRIVKWINIITDKETGRSRGFAFVTMGTDAEAQAVIASLNGRPIDGRSIKLSVAQEKLRDGFNPRPVQQYRPSTPIQEEAPPKTSMDEFPELVPRNSVRSSMNFRDFGHDRMPAQKWEKKKKKRLTSYEED